MAKRSFEVSTEQLLVRFGRTMNNLNVRLFEPEDSQRTVFCFHGFTGNGLDFAVLAELLASNGHKVVCADMLGRGDSTYFDEPRRYSLNNMVKGAVGVIEKYAGSSNAIVGVGWGGLISLLATGGTRTPIGKFVACDLPITFSIDADPVIARGFADAGLRFGSRAAAMAHLLAGPEFAALKSGGAMFAHRVVQDGNVFRFNHDDRITTRTGEFAGRDFDLGELYKGLKAEVLLMYADAVAPGLSDFVGAKPGRWTLTGLSPGGRLLLNRSAELLPLLGFLATADMAVIKE